MLLFLKGGSYLVWKFLFNNILIVSFKGYLSLLAELYEKKNKPEILLSIYISLTAYVYFLIQFSQLFYGLIISFLIYKLE